MLNLDGFKNLITSSVKTLLTITEVDASLKELENKWSKKEILGHLIDSANVNYVRFINALKMDELIFSTYSQDDLVNLQKYNDRKWTELIELWKGQNFHIINLAKNIPTEKLLRKTTEHNFDKICWELIEKGKESTLDYLITDYFGHLEHHTKQIINY